MKCQKLHGVKNGVIRNRIIQKESEELHFYNTSPPLQISAPVEEERRPVEISVISMARSFKIIITINNLKQILIIFLHFTQGNLGVIVRILDEFRPYQSRFWFWGHWKTRLSRISQRCIGFIMVTRERIQEGLEVNNMKKRLYWRTIYLIFLIKGVRLLYPCICMLVCVCVCPRLLHRRIPFLHAGSPFILLRGSCDLGNGFLSLRIRKKESGVWRACCYYRSFSSIEL